MDTESVAVVREGSRLGVELQMGATGQRDLEVVEVRRPADDAGYLAGVADTPRREGAVVGLLLRVVLEQAVCRTAVVGREVSVVA